MALNLLNALLSVGGQTAMQVIRKKLNLPARASSEKVNAALEKDQQAFLSLQKAFVTLKVEKEATRRLAIGEQELTARKQLDSEHKFVKFARPAGSWCFYLFTAGVLVLLAVAAIGGYKLPDGSVTIVSFLGTNLLVSSGMYTMARSKDKRLMSKV